jgi:endonuclease/exonuclease/phosphatase family metal-dependent hydrolase
MPVTDLRVVTYNIHGNRHPDLLAAVVRGLGADVLVVQESFVWSNPLSWWADLASGFGMVHASGGLPSAGNVIFVAAGVTVRDSWTVRFPFTWQEAPRGAAFARCEAGTSTFVVAGSHLSPQGGLRLRQAGVLKDALDRVGGSLIVGADVNAEPGDAGWDRLGAGMVDCAVEWGQGGVPTYSTGQPSRRIDALFASRAVTVAGYQVPDSPQVRAASDHFPVSADFAVP